MVSSNGFKWSHSNKEDNVTHADLSFKSGDIVLCVFDPKEKTLTLSTSS